LNYLNHFQFNSNSPQTPNNINNLRLSFRVSKLRSGTPGPLVREKKKPLLELCEKTGALIKVGKTSGFSFFFQELDFVSGKKIHRPGFFWKWYYWSGKFY